MATGDGPAIAKKLQKHSMLRILPTILLLLFLACSAGAQSPHWVNYAISNGLPSNEAYSVFQDKQGFLWFCTDNGVARFDGESFEIMGARQGLSDPVVFGIHEDSKGRLWFRTYSGKLSYYQDGKIHPYKFNNRMKEVSKNLIIYTLYVDSLDNLWLSGMSKGIISISNKGVVKIDSTGRPGVLYKSFGNDNHVIGINNFRPRFIQIDDINSPLDLSDITQQNRMVQALRWNGKLIVSVNSDIFMISDDGKPKRMFTGLDHIVNLAIDSRNNLWVGYLYHGVDCLAPGFRKKFNMPFLENKSVTQTLEDHEGGYWFSTLESGVYYVPNMEINAYPTLAGTKVTAVIKSAGKILTGDQHGWVRAFEHPQKEVWQYKFPTTILSLYEDRLRHIWISHKWLQVFDSTFNKVRDVRSTKSDFSEDKDGYIWCIGGGQYLGKFNTDGDILLQQAEDIYRSIYVMDTLLFLAPRTGLLIRSTRNLGAIKELPELRNYKIVDIRPVAPNIILLSTNGNGFVLLDTRTLAIRKFDTDNHFIANSVFTTYQNDTSLWLGTENGIIISSLKDLLSGDHRFYCLSQKSGLNGNKINYIESTGTSVWAFTENGVSLIPSSGSHFMNEHPDFYLKEVMINKKESDTSAYKALSHDQNTLSISFGFISYNNNGNILTRFKLSATDPWTFASGRILEFFALAPGSYALTLEYSVDNVHWYTGLKDLAINIKGPWWKTWYYQAVIVLIVALFGYFYFRNQLALTREKQRYLEVINQHQHKLLHTEIQTTDRERMRIAKDLHDTIGTNLVAVKMFVGQLLQKHQEPLATHVEDQLQNVIQETKEIIYNLAPPGLERYGLFVLVKNYSDKMNQASATSIQASTYGEDVFDKALNLVILRVIQELTTNSLKHSHAMHINIFINTFEDRINIIYEDDGIGFMYKENSNGFGLHNIESRIESVNGQIRFESGEYGISYNIDIPYHRK